MIRVTNKLESTVFVSCISYEERTLCSYKNFSSDKKPLKIINFSMKEFEDDPYLNENKQELDRIIGKLSVEREIIRLKWSKPIETIQTIRENFLDTYDNEIVIDISTFPTNILLSLLKTLYTPKRSLDLIYWSPELYATEIGEWLTKGTEKVGPLPDYSGAPTSGQEKVLMIFLGFENERAFKIWEDYEPDKTILVLGKPPIKDHWKKISYNVNKRMISRLNTEIKNVSTSDPKAVKDFLNK